MQGSLSMANIVETAVAAGSFKTLVAAVQAAGLAGTLSGPGPFTVFAPTDAAFAKLPAGTVEGTAHNKYCILTCTETCLVTMYFRFVCYLALLKDIPKLTSILTYHVVAGNNNKPSRNGKSFVTLNGKEISAKVTVDTTDVST